MCGIISYISKNSKISENQFKDACETINHRGPDNTTHWISPNNQVYLGHTRLSIIDFKTGVQPIFSQDKKIAIIVNGEFYNHDEIREDYQKKGYSFSTASDSEILIPLYLEYGIDCLQYLNGEFAFILYDETNNKIFAARDRFGIKPFQFAHYNGDFYFASEAKALFSLGVPSNLDPIALFSSMGLFLRDDKSVFEHVHYVKPAHWLTINLSDFSYKTQSYWNFQYPKIEQIKHYDEQEYIQEFTRLFERAVKIRLRSDQPLGCYLSGGLDSSSVIGVMKKYSTTPVEAFTIAFEDPQYNEGNIAEETSKFVGANQHILQITDKMLVDHFEESVYHVEQPMFNPHGTAKFLLSKFTRDKGVKVVLTGEGADELLAGYIAFKIDDLNVSNIENKEQILKNFLANNPTSAGLFFSDKQVEISDNLKYVQNKLGFVPQFIKVSEGSYTFAGIFLNPKIKHNILNANVLKIVFDNVYNHHVLDGIEPLNKALYLLTKTFLPGYILTSLGDRMELGHALEGRPPFFDKDLVEFIAKLPVAMKIKNWREKHILREAMKDIITPTLYKREKFPYLAPVSRNKNDAFFVYMQDIFNSDALKHSQYFNSAEILKQFEMNASSSPETQTLNFGFFMNVLSVL
ncbi:MAG: asparagine synthase (glutamine-hydrolyzing), partial [Sediminibacterium sp.]|nr:asparagine synthase (glutamine-hydrolyzing) [Sediminibacterium sp.]